MGKPVRSGDTRQVCAACLDNSLSFGIKYHSVTGIKRGQECHHGSIDNG